MLWQNIIVSEAEKDRFRDIPKNEDKIQNEITEIKTQRSGPHMHHFLSDVCRCHVGNILTPSGPQETSSAGKSKGCGFQSSYSLGSIMWLDIFQNVLQRDDRCRDQSHAQWSLVMDIMVVVTNTGHQLQWSECWTKMWVLNVCSDSGFIISSDIKTSTFFI